MSEHGHCERFMLLGPDRVLYAGLLGRPTVRVLGSASVYVSLAGSIEVETADGPVRRGAIAVVPPYVPHHVRAESRSIACVMVEPESVGPGALPRLYRAAEEEGSSSSMTGRIREACAAGPGVYGSEFTGTDLDAILFGAPLEARPLDRRISAIVGRVQRQPSRPLSGQACAGAANLSLSRFLHLFKSETGITFKKYRAWRRARTLLGHANRATNLTHLALDLGYPDSTHFSHSVRRMFGLQPSEIFSGSRRLSIVRSGPAVALGA